MWRMPSTSSSHKILILSVFKYGFTYYLRISYVHTMSYYVLQFASPTPLDPSSNPPPWVSCSLVCFLKYPTTSNYWCPCVPASGSTQWSMSHIFTHPLQINDHLFPSPKTCQWLPSQGWGLVSRLMCPVSLNYGMLWDSKYNGHGMSRRPSLTALFPSPSSYVLSDPLKQINHTIKFDLLEK